MNIHAHDSHPSEGASGFLRHFACKENFALSLHETSTPTCFAALTAVRNKAASPVCDAVRGRTAAPQQRVPRGVEARAAATDPLILGGLTRYLPRPPVPSQGLGEQDGSGGGLAGCAGSVGNSGAGDRVGAGGHGVAGRQAVRGGGERGAGWEWGQGRSGVRAGVG